VLIEMLARRTGVSWPIDTSTAAGKCFLDMLGVFAEFENNLRRATARGHREGEGSGRLQGAAAFDGGPRVCELKAQGMRPTDIAKALKIDRALVYRLLSS
jgi:DNA invertase Pin-like site-specific DNA recombinase